MDIYKNNSWTLLNIRPGGTLGGNKVIWSRDSIKKENKQFLNNLRTIIIPMLQAILLNNFIDFRIMLT
jgi:hypothetical protein